MGYHNIAKEILYTIDKIERSNPANSFNIIYDRCNRQEMDALTIFTIIVGAIAILGFFRIDAIVINNVIKKYWPQILKAINVTNSILWFLILIVFIYIASKNPIWLPLYSLLVCVIIYSLIMSILNTLEQYNVQQRYMRRTSDITMIIGSITLIIISWVVYWPAGFTFPAELMGIAILTSIFVLYFVGFGAYKWLKARW